MTDPRVFLVPHTHWDREWYEPEPRFRQRLTAMLDRLLATLEAGGFPGPVLLDGQTILLRDYLEMRPGAESRVRAAVRSGALLVGPWFVLADELLSSDEALVRNLLLGIGDADTLGRVFAVGYSPDAFGHPAALPTILNGFGITTALVWRGVGDMPGGDLFEWRAPDGSQVLVHHLSPVGYEAGTALLSGPGGPAERWERLAATLLPRSAGRPLLVMVGADHHDPPESLPHVVQVLARQYPDRHFSISSPAEYFAAVGPDPAAAGIAGELREGYGYTWVLQGTHAVRAPLKAAIAEGDRLLRRWAEPLATLAWHRGGDDRRALLDAAWRLHLANGFHDTICGCVGDAAAEDAALRARSVTVQARGVLVDALHDLLGASRGRPRDRREAWTPTLAVVNPSPMERRGICEATLTVPLRDVPVGFPARRMPPAGATAAQVALLTRAGEALPLQVLGRYRAWERIDAAEDYPVQREVEAVRVAFRAPQLPPLGIRCLRVDAGVSVRRDRLPAVRVQRGVLGSTWVTIRQSRQVPWVAQRRDGGRLTSFGQITSETDEGDAYTFQPTEGAEPIRARWSPLQTVWPGPLVAAVARDFDLGRARGRMVLRLDADSELIRIVVRGENRAPGHRLRIHFPAPVAAECLADMQYGPVRRQVGAAVGETAMEWPARTAPMHRYVSLPAGPSIFARGLFEYELTDEGTIAVTLFRSVTELSRGDLGARPGHAAWPQPVPGAALLGPFRAELAVALSGWRAGGEAALTRLESFAEEFHAPLAGLMLPEAVDPPETVAGPRLVGDGVAFKALKPWAKGRGMVLRCVNVSDRVVDGRWELPQPCLRAHRVRLDERAIEKVTSGEGCRRIPFRAGPREVVSIRVEW